MKKSIIYSFSIVFITAVSFLFLSVVDNSENLKKKSSDETKFRELYVDMFNNGVVIIYPTNNSYKIQKKYIDKLKNLRLFFRKIKMDIVADTSVSDTLLKNKVLLIIGTPKSNELFGRIKDKLPINISNNGFDYAGYKFNNPNDIGIFAYKNPFNDKKISFFVIGNDDEYVLKNIRLRYLSGIQIKRDGENFVIGEFKIDKSNNWHIDKNKYWDFGKSRKSFPFDFGNIISHSNSFKASSVQSINTELKNKIKNLENFFGNKFIESPFNYHIFDSFEQKGLIIQNTDLSNYDIEKNSVNVIKNDWIKGDDFSDIAGLLIEKNYGESKYKFLSDGLSTYFSQNWRGKGFEYWASKIYLSNNLPSLKELLDNKMYSYNSNFISNPLSATFIQFYIEKYGKDKLISLFKSKKKISNRIVEKLNKGWKNYLKSLSKKYTEQIKRDKDNFPEPIPGFQKGLSYAHEGYRIHNGYLSKSSYESLKKALELGVNSISIIPFTSIRNSKKPSPLRFWRSAFSENDETIIYLEHISRELNLNLMLKPHIYLGRGWPGDIEMQNEKDWELFFDNYKKWIMHYAVIAEMYKIPLLCIGNELVKTTITHNDQWLELINKIRGIYSGKLTYGANWGEEFEKIKFWDKLDYIGISEYYPLSKKENPSDKELFDGANRIIAKITEVQKKFNKPVIFTEVGFRSSQYPWMTSHEKETRKSINLQNQARSYRAVLKTAYGKKWLIGMYWWKWPSYLSDGGDPQNDLYTPHNKPAEDVLKQWYSIKWN